MLWFLVSAQPQDPCESLCRKAPAHIPESLEDQEGEVQSGAELVLVFEVREDFLTVGAQRKIFLVHK